MKKKNCLIIVVLFLWYACVAQERNINVFTYSVYQTIKPYDEKKIVTLPYKGLLYYYPEKDITISFIRPLYLNDYPDGTIHFEREGNHSWEPIRLNTDTIQYISAVDFLNLKYIYKYNLGVNSSHAGKFDTSYFVWKYTGAEKIIDGYKCFEAEVSVVKGKPPSWTVWVTDEKVDGSVFFLMLRNCPGLIIEASNPSSKFVFRLESFKVQRMTEIDINKIFWPKELSGQNLNYTLPL